MVENKKIWLSLAHMGGEEQAYVQQAFDTNWIAPLGPNVDGFEADLATYLSGDVQVAALSAGTAALHLALVLLGVGQGDEVLCQSFTFSASANPVRYQGATPIFVDSEPDTWNMSPLYLEEAIKDRIAKGKKPKAIIPVHLYGMPAKMDEIIAISKKYDIPIVEDAAEALGSKFNNIHCGVLGKISALSFNGNKIITTSGGGALVSQDEEIVKRTRFLATQARDAAPHYQHSNIGYNYRLSNVLAGIGRGQMKVLSERVARRREINTLYRKGLSDVKGITFHTEPASAFYSNYWLTAILFDTKLYGKSIREDVRLALDAANIESRPLWKPMHLQPIFESFPYYGGGVSDDLFERGLCLPSGSSLSDADIERVIGSIKKIFS